MEKIWSENKYINVLINVLLFLLGIHFLRYGQFILPIICLILFIDNKFVFNISNIKTFIVLCLFAVSFFAFSYKQGFYSLIGFCLPMAYYIGSNIKEVNEKNIKTIIYILTFGMMTHVFLNFIYDISLKGFHTFFSSAHYDIWLQDKASASITAINYIFSISIIYYIFSYEKNKKIKFIFYFCYLLLFLYLIALAERKVLVMVPLITAIAFVLDILFFKKKINIKRIISVLLQVFISITVIIILLFLYKNHFYWYKGLNMRMFGKLAEKGFKSERIEILAKTIKLCPYHLWGNREISSILNIMPHDLWLDVFDWGGVITFVFLAVHTIIVVKDFVTLIKNNKITNEFKTLITPLFLCITLQMLLEPIMTGGTVFLICVIIVEALLEKLNKYAK